MKAIEIYDYLKSKGTWVNWTRSCDRFLFGDPESEVKGIAVGWMPTFPNLQKAVDAKLNLFITHEPLYASFLNQYGIYIGGAISHRPEEGIEGQPTEENDIWVKKGQFLKEKAIVVMRCHDVWDDFPEIGIHGAWAKWLGFVNKPIKQQKFYEVHKVGPLLVKDLAKMILSKVKPIGQDVVHLVGDPEKIVSKMAIGTGAITDYRIMYQMGADVLLLTDDGTRTWESAQWAEDIGVPLLIVNHATAEEPGIRALAGYLQKQFPQIPVKAIERGCLYKTAK